MVFLSTQNAVVRISTDVKQGSKEDQKSDYLDDNPMKKHFSGKEKSIFSFILRWKERF
jgi:hypothetical protein